MKKILLTMVSIMMMVNMYASGYHNIDGLRYLIDDANKTAALIPGDTL